MQIHQAVARFMEAGYKEKTASRFVVYALQAQGKGGWATFVLEDSPNTKSEVEQAFASAGVDPDAVEFPPWYRSSSS